MLGLNVTPCPGTIRTIRSASAGLTRFPLLVTVTDTADPAALEQVTEQAVQLGRACRLRLRLRLRLLRLAGRGVRRHPAARGVRLPARLGTALAADRAAIRVMIAAESQGGTAPPSPAATG